MASVTMPSLDRCSISEIIDRLDVCDVQRCAGVDKQWRAVALEESRWKAFCSTHLHVEERMDQLWSKQPYDTWYQTYVQYMAKFSGLNLRFQDRCVAIRFWQAVRRWAEVHFPLLLRTLNPGLKAEAIREVLAQTDDRIPGVLVALFAVTDGQTLPRTSAELQRSMDTLLDPGATVPPDATAAIFAGVFGKTSAHRTHGIMPNFARAASGVYSDVRARDAAQRCAYGDAMLTRLQRSPERHLFIAHDPGLIARHGPEVGLRADYFTLARSNMWPKSVVVDVRHADRPGGPQVLRHNPVEVSSYSATPGTAPPSSYPLVVDLVTERGKARALAEYRETDAPELCAWLEAFAGQLNSGQVAAKTDSVESTVVSYLELEPSMDGAAECVTQGIRVRARAWATPHGGHDGSLVFSYRIEFSHVLSQGEPVPPEVVRRAKLELRHWDIFAPGDTQPFQQVQGAGVVGDYPIVEPGSVYSYTSMCPGNYGGGMEGWFLFSVLDTGLEQREMVRADCPRIAFEEPDFLF